MAKYLTGFFVEDNDNGRRMLIMMSNIILIIVDKETQNVYLAPYNTRITRCFFLYNTCHVAFKVGVLIKFVLIPLYSTMPQGIHALFE